VPEPIRMIHVLCPTCKHVTSLPVVLSPTIRCVCGERVNVRDNEVDYYEAAIVLQLPAESITIRLRIPEGEP